MDSSAKLLQNYMQNTGKQRKINNKKSNEIQREKKIDGKAQRVVQRSTMSG
ncbi:uncharacterized protein G2W53_020018 [Senna tora]|uniref:Uncharacterized protein n=1 Tax=Senna tora TaxID=362788 RepID=A0A834U2S6_9FABA|nr:uncharacterized protein G2W53_020018 [Senna tora]